MDKSCTRFPALEFYSDLTIGLLEVELPLVPVSLRYIDDSGGLEGLLPAIPPLYQLAHLAWRKLRSGFAAQPSGRPPAVSELSEEPPANPAYAPAAEHVSQSSLRLLLRAAMTPLGVVNDHIDYKALLRNLG